MVYRLRCVTLVCLALIAQSPSTAQAASPTPGLTKAPDALSAAFRAGADTLHAAIDITWDAAAVADSGGSGSAELVTLDGVGVACLTPATGSADPSGGTSAGGNGTTTWTMSCGPIPDGIYLGDQPSAANIARILIFGDTAKDVTDTYFNGLEQINVAAGGRTTNLPDLVDVTYRSSVTDAGGQLVDEAVYIFSGPIATLNAAGAFGVVPDDGGDAATIADSSGPFPGDGPVVDGDEVRIYYPAGTLTNVAQAYVDAEAVTAAGSGLLNQPGQAPAASGTYSSPSVPFGTVLINAGAGSTGNPIVTLTFPNTDRNVLILKISPNPDMSAGQEFAFSPGMTKQWTLATRTAVQTVYVTFSDGNTTSHVHSDSILVDVSRPTIGRLAAPRLVTGTTVTTGIPLYLSWTAATDVGTGVASYRVEASRDGSAYWLVRTTTARQSYVFLWSSHTYRFRVRAVDRVGNISLPATAPSLKATGYQEGSSSIVYRGTWRSSAVASAWGGRLRYATARGASASMTFFGRGFAWVAPTSLSRGTANIYVDGVLVARVSLYRSAANRRIDWVRMWGTNATHRVVIVVSGTAGHPRIDVDAFVVLR